MAADETPSEIKNAKSGLFRLIAIAGVIAACAAGGFVAQKIMKGGGPDEAKADAQTEEPAPLTPQEDFEYYEFDSIRANLLVPQRMRYIVVTPILAIGKAHFQSANKAIETKKLELKSWLTVYLHGCTLDDVSGAENLNRIRREIQDEFNDQLWPDGRPLIDHVLFKDFGIQ